MNTLAPSAFRDALIARLEQTGLSAAVLSRKTGVSKNQIDKLKQKRTVSTNVEDAVLIARFFGLSVEEFIGVAMRHDRKAEFAERIAHFDAQQLEMVETLIAGIIARRANHDR